MKNFLYLMLFLPLLAFAQNKKESSGTIVIKGKTISFIPTEIPMDSIPVYYKFFGKANSRILSKYLRVKYTKPSNFIEMPTGFQPNKNQGEFWWDTSNKTYLESKDKQFIVIIPIIPYATNEEVKKRQRGNNFDFKNSQQTKQIAAFYNAYYDKEKAKKWKEEITYYSPYKAKKKFNSDSAYICNVKLRPEDYYQGTFKHMKIFLIQKKDRGYVYSYCIYTDKAKKHFQEYWAQVEKMFVYE